MKRRRIPIPAKNEGLSKNVDDSTGWLSYWKQFDQLIEQLKTDGNTDLVITLRDAQLFVNGFTDGWFQFLEALDMIIADYGSKMTTGQLKLSSFLAESLRNTLRSR